MKKCIACFLVALIAIWIPFSALVAAISDDVVGTSYESAVQRMELLGIMSGYEDGNFRPNDPITRAEFAQVLLRTLRFQEIPFLEEPFIDVPETHWAFGVIATLKTTGLMLGTGNGYFEPESYVTYAQVVKTLVTALGYAVAVETSASGEEWYEPYFRQAMSLMLLKGISFKADTSVTRGDIAILITNALKVPFLELDGSRYRVNNDSTLQSRLLSDGAELRGVVDANYRTGIGVSKTNRENYVLIGDLLCNVGDTNAAELLGMQVRFRVEMVDDETFIRHIIPYSNKMFETWGEELNYANGVFYYNYDKTDRQKRISLSKRFMVVYNGAAILNYTGDIFTNENAYIKFIDNDSDGAYDIAFVETSVITTTLRTSLYEEILYVKDMLSNEKNYIDLREYEEVSLRSEDGNPLTLEDFAQEDTVLEIYISPDDYSIEIYKLDKIVEGMPEELIEGDGNRSSRRSIVLAGEAYIVLKSVNISFNSYYTFTLDRRGRIVYVKEDKHSGNEVYGYVYKLSMWQSLNNEPAVMLVLGTPVESIKENDIYYLKGTTRQQVVTYKTAQNFRIDGAKLSGAWNGRLSVGDVIRFRLNSAGELVQAYRALASGNFGDRVLNAKELVLGRTTYGAFGMDYNSVVFFLPASSNEEDFYAEIKLKNNEVFTCQGFDLDDEVPVASAALVQTAINSDAETYFAADEPFCIVQGISQVISENGDICYRMTGYRDGKVVDLTTNPNSARVNDIFAHLGAGSVIRYSLDFDNRINAAEHVRTGLNNAPYAQLTPNGAFYDEISAPGGSKRVFGIVTETKRKFLDDYSNIYENFLRISSSVDGIGAVDYTMACHIDDAPDYYVYNCRESKVFPAQFEDVVSIITGGENNASRVFLTIINNDVKLVIIVR